MYPKAVEMGIDSDRFWQMTYDEIIVQAEANKKIRDRDFEEKARLDYKAAQLNAFALNAPKKMPKFEEHYQLFKKTVDEQGDSKQSNQQDWQLMKARMIERAAMIKDTRNRKQTKEERG